MALEFVPLFPPVCREKGLLLRGSDWTFRPFSCLVLLRENTGFAFRRRCSRSETFLSMDFADWSDGVENQTPPNWIYSTETGTKVLRSRYVEAFVELRRGQVLGWNYAFLGWTCIVNKLLPICAVCVLASLSLSSSVFDPLSHLGVPIYFLWF